MYNSYGTNNVEPLYLTLPDAGIEADGTEMWLHMKRKGSYDLIVTPDTFYSGTKITFNAVDQIAHLIHAGSTGWVVLYTTAIVS